MVKLTVKAIRVGNSVRVAIPSEVLKAANISVGDSLLVDFDEKQGLIILEKANAKKE